MKAISVFSHKGTKVNKTEGNTVYKELFLRYAQGKNQMSINSLRDIIMKSGTPDDDFKRACLFHNWCYSSTNSKGLCSFHLPLVREISEIPKFNWGKFTM